MENNVNVNFPEKFRPLLTQKARYKVWYGGRGSGKSWSFARAIIVKAASSKIRVLCCREIQSSIRESVHKLLSDSIEQMGLSGMFTINEREIRCHMTGSEFIFEGLFRNQTRIKSLESIDLTWVEEGQTISEESLQLLFPTIRNPESEIWICFNTRYETDPVWRRFVVNSPDNAIVVKVGWEDNPWFPEVLKKEMEDDYLYRPDEAANVWGGELKRMGSAVWCPPFDPTTHIKEFDLKLIKDYKIFQSLDPHTAYFSASIWCARWKVGDRFRTWVFDEYPRFSDVNGDYADIRKKLHYNGTVADLSRTFFARETGFTIEKRYIDTRFSKGFGAAQSNLVNTTEGLVESFAKPANGGILFLMPAEVNIDGANDKIKTDFRWNTMAERTSLNEPCLYISSKCKNLIMSMKNHRFQEDNEREEETFKDFSDCLTILYGGLSEYRWPAKPKPRADQGYQGEGGWMGS
jgi:phage terminase large subunit